MALPKANLSEAEVHAIRALLEGTASAQQQVAGMAAIVAKMCRRFDTPYIEGNTADTHVMIGRHQIGTMITACNTEETLEAARNRDLDLRKAQP